jgi:hypothetical protein
MSFFNSTGSSRGRSVRRFQVTANFVPSSPILVTQMMGALSSSETSSLRRATRRNIPEDAILQRHSIVISEQKVYTRGGDSRARIATGSGLEGRGSTHCTDKRFLFIPHSLQRPWGPIEAPGYRRLFPGGGGGEQPAREARHSFPSRPLGGGAVLPPVSS